MYKFRTMTNGYDNPHDRLFMQAFVAGRISEDHATDTATFKPISKQHITRVGRVLRKASLDELPQIFNIIKGEMSIVGPRPNTIWEVDAYLDWHHERLNVLPGVTGLAQVNGRSKISFDQIAQFDVEYVRNVCLSLDFWILGRTLWTVLTGNGAG
jgi:lipopolysaccharide/colanic/teichoic acid biosynthesis glycosyltransferase